MWCNYNGKCALGLYRRRYDRVYLSIGSFKGECHIKTWICQIAKNVYYLYLRKNKKTDNLKVSSSVFDKEYTCEKAYIRSTEEIYENKEMFNWFK